MNAPLQIHNLEVQYFGKRQTNLIQIKYIHPFDFKHIEQNTVFGSKIYCFMK